MSDADELENGTTFELLPLVPLAHSFTLPPVLGESIMLLFSPASLITSLASIPRSVSTSSKAAIFRLYS